MSLIERLFRRGAATPTVAGRPARVPDGVRIYAIGDIHGRYDLLRELELMIVEDSRTQPLPTTCTAIYLGDFVDRGQQSKEVIEHLQREMLPGVDKVLLSGNHDLWFRHFAEGSGAATSWLLAGAESTLLSYGVVGFPDPSDAMMLHDLRRKLHARMPPLHLRFLQNLSLYHEVGDYLFVHAGIRPGIPLDEQDPQDLMFIREPFLSATTDFGCVVVHGHTVVDEPVVRQNRIGIDTGAVWTGKLTAVVLEADTHRFLSTDG